MSAAAVRQIITRAVEDPHFRGELLRDPAAASAAYDLTDAERWALGNVTPANFSAVAAGLADRAGEEATTLTDSYSVVPDLTLP
jgi:hypothetical protein